VLLRVHNKYILIKILAWLVIVTFSSSEAARAISIVAPPTVSRVIKRDIQEIINNPSRLDIPTEFVTLKEFHRGTNGKLIIHIQDAHTNYSGQLNMAKALDRLMNQYDISLVLSEGSAKDSTLTELRKVLPLKQWKILAKKYLLQGIIQGEEYLNLTTEHPMKIMGIEYKDLYDKQVLSYAGLKDKRKEILKYLHQIKISIERVKNKLYPKELLNYEQTKNTSFHTKRSNLPYNFEALLNLAKQSNINLSNYPEVSKLQDIRDKEGSIQFSKAQEEEQALFDALNSKGEGELLNRFRQIQKNSHLSQLVLISRLFDLAKRHSIPLDDYQELQRYKTYLKTFSSLKLETLLNDFDLLEKSLYSQFLITEDNQKLRAVGQYVHYLNKAYQIQMSSKEFATLKASHKDFVTISWQAFINQKTRRPELLR